MKLSYFWLILAIPCSTIYAQEPPTKVEHKGMVYMLENGHWVVSEGEANASSVSVLKDGKYTIYKAIRVASNHSLEVLKLGKWSQAVGQSIAVDDIKYKFENGRWIVSDGIRVKDSEVQVFDSGNWVTKSQVVVKKEKPAPAPEPIPTPPPQKDTEKEQPPSTKISKDDCVKSGYHWVDEYPGHVKCFTTQEFEVYNTYGSDYSCTQNGYYRFLHKTGLFSGFSFCANVSKGLEYCNEQFTKERPYGFRTFTEPHCRQICTDLKKTYNETNGQCE